MLDTATGSYVWPGLDLRPSPGRGKGVFASQPLPAGLLVPYGGQEATPARVWWLGKHDKDRFVARTGGGCTSGVDAERGGAVRRRIVLEASSFEASK
jgi:hypothetical protein